MASTAASPPLVTEFWMGHQRATWSDGKRHCAPVNSTVSERLQRAFLPEGWPRSVTPDYLQFQAWDTVQAVCSYVRGMLTSQAIMRGIGVGKEAATPLGAVFQFFVRDLTGMVGGVLFAYFEGSSFDSCAKQWRLFADIANNIGMFIEMISPLFPSVFLLLACLGSLARAVTGVAAGATRAALTQHFALRGNAADVSAKEQSQETAVTAVGMVLGMVFTRITSGHRTAEWALFVVLTVLHLWCNIRALRALVLSSLNQPRLDCLVEYYIADKNAEKTVSTPQEVGLSEDLMPPPIKRAYATITGALVRAGYMKASQVALLRSFPVLFGDRLEEEPSGDSKGTSMDVVRRYIKDAGTQRYIVIIKPEYVKVVLHHEAKTTDLLQAYVHAFYASIISTALGAPLTESSCTNVEAVSQAWMKEFFDGFKEALVDKHWQVDRVLLPTCGWTAAWKATDDLHND